MSHGLEVSRALPAAHQLVVGLVGSAPSDASRLRLGGEPQDVNECPFLYDSYEVRMGAISWTFEPSKLGFTQYVVGGGGRAGALRVAARKLRRAGEGGSRDDARSFWKLTWPVSLLRRMQWVVLQPQVGRGPARDRLPLQQQQARGLPVPLGALLPGGLGRHR
jgi:hypothetical protein